MAACHSGHDEVAEALLSSGRCGDLEARENRGRIALLVESCKGHVGVVHFLLEGRGEGKGSAGEGRNGRVIWPELRGRC